MAINLRATGKRPTRMVCLSDAIVNRNGVGTYYKDLVDHLKDIIDVAELICPEADGNNGAFNVRLPLPGDPTQRLYIPRVHALFDRIQSINPDVIVTPTPGPFGLTGCAFAKYLNAYLCVGYHTQYDKLTALYWKNVVSRISSGYLKLYNQLMFPASDVVVANSDEMVERARLEGARTVKMIGTPIAKAFLDTPAEPPSGAIRSVCYCGRLTVEKNMPDILAAAERLPKMQFVIAGDGPLRSEVEAAEKRLENLHYAGWVSRGGVKSIIDRSDMMILPSQVESFGTIALEAMARRRPVLVSKNCGILNWPDLRRGIYVIESGESLTEAIVRIAITNASAKTEKADRAYWAAKEFNSHTIAQWTDMFPTHVEKAWT